MRLNWLAVLGGMVAVMVVLVGCEWENAGDEDSWDGTVGWVNFSGVYRAADEGLLVRVGFASVQRTGFATIGTGSDTTLRFTGVLTPTVVPGSVFGSDGKESLTDASTGTGTGTSTNAVTGNLTGDRGGSGTVNYQTGAISLTFFDPPDAGDRVFVSYLYEERVGGGNVNDPLQGSTVPIYALTVQQTGNWIRLIDDRGNVFEGQVFFVETGGASDGDTAGTVVGQFEATGTVNGVQVTIVGNLQGAYADPEEGENEGIMVNRTIEGTWIETGGMSGMINGVAADPPDTEIP